jgi:two-component system, NtrC family, sensor kinase
MAGETILVVDDNESLLDLLQKHILGRLGYKVQCAWDGRQGLQLAHEIKPDAILLDMNMPRMSGMEMLSALRYHDINAPVVFMTGSGSEYIAVQAFRLGVFDYLTKPFSPQEVEEAIDRALQVTRLQEEKEELAKSLAAADAGRQMVVTLAHYINNQLMVVNGGLELGEELLQEPILQDPATAVQILLDSRQSVRQIKAVLRVMNNLTKVKLTTYYDKIRMLDIETAVQSELTQMIKSSSNWEE